MTREDWQTLRHHMRMPVFAFIALILVLTLRPSGLLGERVADRA